MRERGAASNLWLWAICAAQVPMMLVYANYVAALPLLKAEWGLTNAQAGTIYTAFYVGYILASAALATATDYMSAKKIYLASSLWLALLNLTFPVFAEGFASASLFRGLAGVGLAGTYAPALRLVAEYAPEGKRARMVGAYTFFYTVGVAASIYATGALVARYEWRAAFALTSLGPAVGFLSMALLLPGLPAPRADEDAGFRFPRLPAPVWALMGVVGAHRWEVFAFRGWIVTFLAASLVVTGEQTRESALRAASSSAALIIALSAVSKLIGGWFADRVGRPPTIIHLEPFSERTAFGLHRAGLRGALRGFAGAVPGLGDRDARGRPRPRGADRRAHAQTPPRVGLGDSIRTGLPARLPLPHRGREIPGHEQRFRGRGVSARELELGAHRPGDGGDPGRARHPLRRAAPPRRE